MKKSTPLPTFEGFEAKSVNEVKIDVTSDSFASCRKNLKAIIAFHTAKLELLDKCEKQLPDVQTDIESLVKQYPDYRVSTIGVSTYIESGMLKGGVSFTVKGKKPITPEVGDAYKSTFKKYGFKFDRSMSTQNEWYFKIEITFAS